MQNLTRNICRLIMIVSIVVSCDSGFDATIPTEPIPVVYGIISPQDSLYYIRLTKTYIGQGNALDFARIPDSIYYNNARVFLETRDLNNNLIEQAELGERIIEDRLPGIFATTPNRIFQTDATKIHLRPEDFISAGQPYELNLHVKVVIPGYSDTVHSMTRLRTVPRITQPQSTINRVYLYNDNPFFMQWMDTNAESHFQMLVRVHYTDYLYDEKREMLAEWVLTGISVNSVVFPYGERTVYSYYFRPEDFYSKLRKAIPADPLVEVRICGKLDFVILSSNREMEYYRNVYEISDDYHGAGYSNVENGFGLFTTYSSTGINGLTLGPTELDSLEKGRYTNTLKFKHY